MNSSHLQAIRKYELNKILPEIAKGSLVLDIGSGAGWQARTLFEHGFSVEAIDIEPSDNPVWPVTIYDGRNIPFPDNHFDVVFSSYVLEHVSNMCEFQNEIKRVLKETGIAIHIVPTAAWRFWTSVAHYIFLFKRIFQIYRSKVNRDLHHRADEEYREIIRKAKETRKLKFINMILFPARHGAIGDSAISELYYFSRFRWKSLFKNKGWKVRSTYSMNLFYTGYNIFDSHIPIHTRYIMGLILGSPCHVYVVQQL